MMKTLRLVAAMTAIASIVGMGGFCWSALAAVNAPTESIVDGNGNFHVPEGYRTRYQALGSWSIAAGEGQGAKEMHDVYASPGAIEAFRRDGQFPDNTVLIKEVYQTATAQMTTGTVSHADILKGWFVMVKSAQAHYPGNNLWGDGWGWAWFDAANPEKTTTTNYKVSCLVCHVPAKGTDWIYISGYPALKQ